MGEFFVRFLYIIFVFILGILAFIFKKKHSPFPDFRVGYHNKKIMESEEKWECANNVAGNLCALFAVIGIILFIISYFAKQNLSVTLIVFFLYCIATILAILIVPIQLSKKQ